MQSVSSRIWTGDAVSISYDDNYNATGTSKESPMFLRCFDSPQKRQILFEIYFSTQMYIYACIYIYIYIYICEYVCV